MADARDGPSVAARLKLCAQATGEAVAPQDEAMIRILSRLAVENNWWSFSVNPTPTGKQFIFQPQSQWERDRERQQAKEGSAPPQPAHPQHQQVQQPQPNESPEGWTRVGKGGMPDRMGRYTLLLLLAGCQPIASSTVLQTDSIRFGTGSEDSIQVGVENIQQPFAFVGGAFTKLTYSAYPMDFELQAGGSTATACLGFDFTDESGFIGTSSDGTNNFGFGSISATKTCSIGGATLSIDWTFTLSASNSKALSLAITVSSSGAAASDVQVWWGTRDDWVGTTDGPAKTIGSITSVSSGFTSAAGTTGNAEHVRRQ
ncbi:hypothetical protein EMIHUDRAFT_250244 [Emiliania huxleyi CCMP1516]|uniref:WW domain-containing protein n=2 Tax=Emiliania huxleyi TaxID=2903 RepID=A0A0D3I2Q7_EMIH1|nr:hypothetical protein EMIHUDRAFT_250244 [Emiliania huxleyi CCMP1516]EOD05542.1 hypothetical protein EMIHUDRAFT_250244 [Emiliania huxleyi CCMP1516]|eukprot:XP_005757971.1 hypothetical protein EMIHUDRAFT_250244 [Emiliania huxleyi CCMP1516]